MHVSTGRLYDPNSPLRLIDRWLTSSSVALRIRARASILAILVVLALAGAGAICLQVTKTFRATAVVSLPMEARAGTPLSSVSAEKLESAADLWLAKRGEPIDGATLAVRTGYSTDSVLITGSAASRNDAIGLVDSAANIAVNRDRALWALAVAKPDASLDLGSVPLAQIVQPADPWAGGGAQQYSLSWNPARFRLAIAWAAAMAALAVLCLAIPQSLWLPLSTRKETIADLPDSEDLLDSVPVDVVSLPSLAGIVLVPAAQQHPAKIVLTDVDANLWSWLTGHVKVADSENAVAEPPLAERGWRQFLITRCMDGTAGSRSVAIAFGRALSLHGISAVIVDADPCASQSLQDEFGFPEGAPGLVQILKGTDRPDDCILGDDDYPGLDAIASGSAAMARKDADDLISSPDFENLLESLGRTYPIVLVHGPTAVQAAGALSIVVDATLIAMPEDATDVELDALAWSLGRLMDAGANVIGRVDICDGEPAQLARN